MYCYVISSATKCFDSRSPNLYYMLLVTNAYNPFSLGGFTALAAAASLPEKVVGVVLLNSAGQFGDANVKPTEPEDNPIEKFILKPLKDAFQRVVLGFLFWQAKQPARVESVLKSVSCYLLKS